MKSWKDNKCSPGGCSLEEVMRCTRPEKTPDKTQPVPEWPDRVDVYTKAQDKYIFNGSFPAGFPAGTEPLQVPEKLYTKKELDDVVKGMDLVVESFTRRISELKSQQDVYVEEAKLANDRGIRQGLTFSKVYSELSDTYEAYRTLVHAREHMRSHISRVDNYGYYDEILKTQSILTNALIDMEG